MKSKIKKRCHAELTKASSTHVVLKDKQQLPAWKIPGPRIKTLRGGAQGNAPVWNDACFNNGGFTLIELLVVVLIIGILAAVAVPQYTLAVNKTRFANLRTMASTFITAAQAYHLANGTWPSTFEEIAVDVPAGFEIITANGAGRDYDCGQNSDMYCCMVPQKGSADAMVVCSRKDKSFAYSYSFSHSRHYCVADPNDTHAIKLCQAVTGKKTANATAWYLYTVTGYDKAVHYYVL